LCTQGIRTTCGSNILSNFIPTYTATAVKKVLQAGAVLIGKTNMDEFAMGSSTENSAFGPTRNPVNTEHVPGGSSGGSAAAVSGGETILAIGTDTGGSIRLPSAYCGVAGIKAHIWQGLAVRVDCLCLISGSNRRSWSNYRRLRHVVERDLWTRRIG